jgi:hypothetical protein
MVAVLKVTFLPQELLPNDNTQLDEKNPLTQDRRALSVPALA